MIRAEQEPGSGSFHSPPRRILGLKGEGKYVWKEGSGAVKTAYGGAAREFTL